MGKGRRGTRAEIFFGFFFIISWSVSAETVNPDLPTIHETSILAQEDSGDLPPLEEDRPPSGIPGIVAPVGLGFQELIDLSLQQNPEIANARARLSEMRAQADATGLAPNPAVTGGGKKVSGGHSGPVLEIEQELPINGSLRLDRRAADLEYQAEQRTLKRRIQLVISELGRAYVELLRSQAMAEVENRGLRLAEHSLEIVRDRFESGLASSLPFNQSQAEVARSRSSLLAASKEIQTARTGIAVLLGLSESSVPSIRGNLWGSFLSQPAELVQPNRPDLEAVRLQKQAAEASTLAAQRERIPNPVVGYSREEAGDDTENFFTVGLEIPIFNSGIPEVRRRRAGAEAIRSRYDGLEKTIQAEVEKAQADLDLKGETVRIFETEIRPANERYLESIESAFDSGTTDLSLLLTAQTEVLDQEREFIQALSQLRLSEIDYLSATGRIWE